jgi:hypothetical protein
MRMTLTDSPPSWIDAASGSFAAEPGLDVSAPETRIINLGMRHERERHLTTTRVLARCRPGLREPVLIAAPSLPSGRRISTPGWRRKSAGDERDASKKHASVDRDLIHPREVTGAMATKV